MGQFFLRDGKWISTAIIIDKVKEEIKIIMINKPKAKKVVSRKKK